MGREESSIWIAIGALLLVGVILWMNWRYQIVFPDKLGQLSPLEGFEGDVPVGSSAGPMVRTVLQPYMDPRLCTIFTKMRTTLILANSTTASPTDPEAIEKTDAQLAMEIPGGPAACVLQKLPPDSADDTILLEYVNALPRDLLARIVFTAQYMNRNLQQKEKDIAAATSGKQASTEGFQPLCAPSVADTRRAELKKRDAGASPNKDSAKCVNPEELTPEQLRNQIQIVLQEIQSTSNAAYAKASTTTPLTPTLLAPLLEDSERILQKLDGVKQQAENNTLVLPKVG